MIKKLKIENFKSIKSAEIDCKKINILIGEPNTGKSNFLEALGFLSFLNYGSSSLKDFIRFQYIQDLFFDKDVSKEIHIQVDNDVIKLKQISQLQFDVLNKTDQKIASFDLMGNAIGPYQYDFSSDIKFYRFKQKDKFDRPEPGALLPPNGDNLVMTLRTNPELLEIITEMLSKFGAELSLKEMEGKIEVLRKYKGAYLTYPYELISDTLQRIIFFISAIESNKNSVLAFEEPEAHAFPYYVKYLSERIALDDRNNQYFISTHNPYFLLPILEKTDKDDVNILITKIENYETKLYPLSEEQKEKLLEFETDIFFNIDNLIS